MNTTLKKRIAELETTDAKPETTLILIGRCGREQDGITGIKGVPFTVADCETVDLFMERANAWIKSNHRGVFISFYEYTDDDYPSE